MQSKIERHSHHGMLMIQDGNFLAVKAQESTIAIIDVDLLRNDGERIMAEKDALGHA